MIFREFSEFCGVVSEEMSRLFAYANVIWWFLRNFEKF